MSRQSSSRVRVVELFSVKATVLYASPNLRLTLSSVAKLTASKNHKEPMFFRFDSLKEAKRNQQQREEKRNTFFFGDTFWVEVFVINFYEKKIIGFALN